MNLAGNAPVLFDGALIVSFIGLCVCVVSKTSAVMWGQPKRLRCARELCVCVECLCWLVQQQHRPRESDSSSGAQRLDSVSSSFFFFLWTTDETIRIIDEEKAGLLPGATEVS